MIMKVKKVEFRVSDFDQNLLYRIYEDYDFDLYLGRLDEFVTVERVESKQMDCVFYRYSFVLDSQFKKNVILDFGTRLIEYAGFELAKLNFEKYATVQSFGCKLLKCLI